MFLKDGLLFSIQIHLSFFLAFMGHSYIFWGHASVCLIFIVTFQFWKPPSSSQNPFFFALSHSLILILNRTQRFPVNLRMWGSGLRLFTPRQSEVTAQELTWRIRSDVTIVNCEESGIWILSWEPTKPTCTCSYFLVTFRCAERYVFAKKKKQGCDISLSQKLVIILNS